MTLDAWRAAGGEFHFDGRRIFCAGEGSGRAGEALLLIHGFPTSSYDWHRIWGELGERFRLVAPDMLGFGFSDKPVDHDYRIAEQADLHEHLCDLLAIDRVHILAHDYGDTVTQELLARALEGSCRFEIQSVCLLNGGLFPEAHRPLLVQKLLAGPLGSLLSRFSGERPFARSFAPIFGPDTRPTAAEMRDYWRVVSHDGGQHLGHRLLAYLQERVENRDRWVGALEGASAHGIPLRFVNGLLDPVSGGHMLTRYRALVPDPDWVALERIGHYPQVEDPAGVLRAYWAFLQRNGLLPD